MLISKPRVSREGKQQEGENDLNGEEKQRPRKQQRLERREGITAFALGRR